MGVCSDGSYGTEPGLVYSFPVEIANGDWKIVQGLNVDDFSREKMNVTQKELQEERNSALESCEDWLATANL